MNCMLFASSCWRTQAELLMHWLIAFKPQNSIQIVHASNHAEQNRAPGRQSQANLILRSCRRPAARCNAFLSHQGLTTLAMRHRRSAARCIRCQPPVSELQPLATPFGTSSLHAGHFHRTRHPLPRRWPPPGAWENRLNSRAGGMPIFFYSDPKTVTMSDAFSARSSFDTGNGSADYYRLTALEDAGLTKVDALPYSIRVLLESVLRNCDDYVVNQEDVKAVANWADKKGAGGEEIPFKPARVVLQDFTGVPAVVDLAAMRSAMQRLGGDPNKINPLVPADLVIDHSVQVDHYLGDRRARLSTSTWNSTAIASDTNSSAGARRRSTTSASFRPAPASSTR